MSEIRVNRIESYEDISSITISGITTFSSIDHITLSGGDPSIRPQEFKEGQIRYISGDVKQGLEYYNGYEWITVEIAYGENYQGITPIGVFAGGQSSPVSVNANIDFITLTSIGYNASTFGNLSSGRSQLSGCSSSTMAIFAGGTFSGSALNTTNSVVISARSNAQAAMTLSQARKFLSGCSSQTRGIFAGGDSGTAPTITLTNVIDYITIVTSSSAQNFGDLQSGGTRRALAACSSSTHGIFAGGQISPGTTVTNLIDYITIQQLGNGLNFGDLSTTFARSSLSSCSSATRGVFAGGAGSAPTLFNVIDYITIATTGNAQDFGNLNGVREALAACSSATRGVFAGGTTPAYTNTIEYITISSIGNALDFSDLTLAREDLAGISNNHGGLINS